MKKKISVLLAICMLLSALGAGNGVIATTQKVPTATSLVKTEDFNGETYDDAFITQDIWNDANKATLDKDSKSLKVECLDKEDAFTSQRVWIQPAKVMANLPETKMGKLIYEFDIKYDTDTISSAITNIVDVYNVVKMCGTDVNGMTLCNRLSPDSVTSSIETKNGLAGDDGWYGVRFEFDYKTGTYDLYAVKKENGSVVGEIIMYNDKSFTTDLGNNRVYHDPIEGIELNYSINKEGVTYYIDNVSVRYEYQAIATATENFNDGTIPSWITKYWNAVDCTVVDDPKSGVANNKVLAVSHTKVIDGSSPSSVAAAQMDFSSWEPSTDKKGVLTYEFDYLLDGVSYVAVKIKDGDGYTVTNLKPDKYEYRNDSWGLSEETMGINVGGWNTIKLSFDFENKVMITQLNDGPKHKLAFPTSDMAVYENFTNQFKIALRASVTSAAKYFYIDNVKVSYVDEKIAMVNSIEIGGSEVENFAFDKYTGYSMKLSPDDYAALSSDDVTVIYENGYSGTPEITVENEVDNTKKVTVVVAKGTSYETTYEISAYSKRTVINHDFDNNGETQWTVGTEKGIWMGGNDEGEPQYVSKVSETDANGKALTFQKYNWTKPGTTTTGIQESPTKYINFDYINDGTLRISFDFYGKIDAVVNPNDMSMSMILCGDNNGWNGISNSTTSKTVWAIKAVTNDNTQVTCYGVDNGASTVNYGQQNLAANQWNHIDYEIDLNTSKIHFWINGKLCGTSVFSDTYKDAFKTNGIGAIRFSCATKTDDAKWFVDNVFVEHNPDEMKIKSMDLSATKDEDKITVSVDYKVGINGKDILPDRVADFFVGSFLEEDRLNDIDVKHLTFNPYETTSFAYDFTVDTTDCARYKVFAWKNVVPLTTHLIVPITAE